MLPLLKSATEIAADLRAGRCSSRELVDAYMQRIERSAEALNAVVVRRFDEARAEASAADDARVKGRSHGQLAGVPVTIKEAFDVAGLPTTFGHTDRAGHRAASDAVAVARLRAAGAIVMGKTNVPKDLADWQSFNDVYGVTRNPWDQSRTPGGSSGGSAAALAAGLTALELGSDIAGSIRVPAVYCGVYGHKPTFNIVPTRGHSLVEGAVPSDISVSGPLARSAVDLELALDITAGADHLEPGMAGWRLALPQETRSAAREFRVAVVDTDAHYPVDGSIRSALGALADHLEKEGAQVDRSPKLPIGSEEGYELFITLLRGATSARYTVAEVEALVAKAKSYPADDNGYDALMHRGWTQTHRGWLAANERRQALRRGWRAFFERYDALICPVTNTPPFPHMIGVPKIEQFFIVDGKKRPASDYYYWIGIPALSYLPATALPIGSSPEGLPVGAQIIGPEFGDKRCLRLAQIIERSFRSFIPPPAYAV
jgi:amidase